MSRDNTVWVDETKELQIFASVHGIPLTVGLKVTIDPRNEYANEWQGEFLVTGISWDIHSKRISVTIAEDWNDGGSDGWGPEDLHPALRKAKA